MLYASAAAASFGAYMSIGIGVFRDESVLAKIRLPVV